MPEGIAFYGCDAVRDGEPGQTAAHEKCTVANRCDSLRDVDPRQVHTLTKGPLANGTKRLGKR